jgi:rod shape-determining protein MreB
VVFFIEEPMAAAIGAGLPITEPTGSMVVDIGGGTTEVAVISLAGIVSSKSVRVAGNKMDEAILQHIRKRYNLLIGITSAEVIKTTIGSAFPSDQIETVEVKGRDMTTGFPKILTVDSKEIMEIISDQTEKIVEIVHIVLEQTPPELAADIADKGIVLTGGGALLKNMDALLKERLMVPISVAEDPLTTVVVGAGKALDNISIMREIAVR